MSATIESRPLLVRLTTTLLGFVQSSLMLAGIALIAGLFALAQGERRVVDQLVALAPQSDGAIPASADAGETGADNEMSPSILSPRMRGALDSVSRRYRVSAAPLVPVFAAAEAAGREHRIDPLLIVSVIAVESRFNPFSESVMGAQGLMQVVPRFHQDKLPDGADEQAIFDPVLNVRVGARILKDSIRRNGGVVPGLQQFAGAADDPEQRYATKVLAELARLEAAGQRGRSGQG